ncbi:MAG: 30S ribosomal protein S16 [Chloroflexota bacterium]|nr:30S ribosomal protein S16 [Chloroflexota bacterium]
MLKIRLRRMGAIRQPHYRIVVADARAPRDGAFIDTLGSYNPLTNPATINVDVARYEEWRQKGAQPTEAVVSLVRQYNRAVRQGTQAPTPLTKKAQRAQAFAASQQASLGSADEMAAQSPGGGDEQIEAGAGGVTGIGASVAPAGVEGEDISLAEAMAPSIPGEPTSDPMITGTGPGGQTGDTASNTTHTS